MSKLEIGDEVVAGDGSELVATVVPPYTPPVRTMVQGWNNHMYDKFSYLDTVGYK